jgi:AcrR family transcriptional regulator
MNNTTTELTGDTRARIQQVALTLFTEQGYEKTSLREIAEHLGVTKAALYYHFKSKEELFESFIADRLAAMDDQIAWLRSQPRTVEVRRDFVRRYAESLYSGHYRQVMHCLENNQATMKAMPIGHKMRDRFKAMVEALVDRDDPLPDQLRVALGMWAVNTSWFILDAEIPDDERRAAAIEVALDLVSQPASDRAEPDHTAPDRAE